MTIASEANRSGPYACNGVTTHFPYQFRIYDEAHIRVILTGSDGTETTLALGSDYAVSGVGDSGGGAVETAAAYAAGYRVTLILNVPFTQDTDLENQGAYFAETIERAIDLQTQMSLQLKEQVARAVVLPVTSSVSVDRLTSSVLALAEIQPQMQTLAPMAQDIVTVAGIADAVVAAAGNADTATAAAAVATGKAAEAAESAAAAATWNPATYSTTAQISALLAGYVPTTRTIASGTGVLINGGAGAALGATVTVSLDFATDPEILAGTDAGKPVAPAGMQVAIAAALATISGVPIGTWDHFSGQTPPAGYLVRDGSAVSRTVYAALFAVCGTKYGAGDGSTTFNLPDGRGVFDRGWDSGRGLDAGRVFGSYQADMFASHVHTYTVSGGSNSGGGGTSSFAGNSTTGATGGTETRPKNIAGLPIIRAY
ncbi:MAG: Tail Collar domain protein [Proteobacteria bacterium]|nr:Tail Collar domain protein [Pseudomonadota bacterium]